MQKILDWFILSEKPICQFVWLVILCVPMLANELQNVWLYAEYIHETAVRNIEKVAVCVLDMLL